MVNSPVSTNSDELIDAVKAFPVTQQPRKAPKPRKASRPPKNHQATTLSNDVPQSFDAPQSNDAPQSYEMPFTHSANVGHLVAYHHLQHADALHHGFEIYNEKDLRKNSIINKDLLMKVPTGSLINVGAGGSAIPYKYHVGATIGDTIANRDRAFSPAYYARCFATGNKMQQIAISTDRIPFETTQALSEAVRYAESLSREAQKQEAQNRVQPAVKSIMDTLHERLHNAHTAGSAHADQQARISHHPTAGKKKLRGG